jgi:hypothetical protein
VFGVSKRDSRVETIVSVPHVRHDSRVEGVPASMAKVSSLAQLSAQEGNVS